MGEEVKEIPKTGSIKNKIVAEDLLAERKNCNFDKNELSTVIWGGKDGFDRTKSIWADMESDPALMPTEKWYDMSREEQQETSLRKLRLYFDKFRDKYFL
jgi:hypothetical protein